MMTRMHAAFALWLRRAPLRRFARRQAFLCACLAGAGIAAAQTASYLRFFPDDTMRVDYLHTGGPAGEGVVLDRVVREGPWPGNGRHLIDDANLGEYVFEVADRASGRMLYSRGFGS